MQARRLRLGLLSAAAALAGAALAVVLLQTFSRPELRLRWDWTSAGRAGLSERTAEALANLPEGSRLTAFLFEENPSFRLNGSAAYPRAFGLLRTLLEDARIRARGRLEVTVLDEGSSLVAVEQARQRLERQPGETLVLETPEQRQVLRFEQQLFVVSPFDPRDGVPARLRQERVDDALGDAALRLGRAELPRVGIVGGYFELVRNNPGALRDLAQLLRSEGFEPVILQGPAAAERIDLLLVPGQSAEFLPEDAAAAGRALRDGLPLLLALGAAAPEGVAAFWNGLLADAGVRFEPGLVCEPFGGRLGLRECQLLEIPSAQMESSHEATRLLTEAGRSVLVRFTRPLTIGAGAPDYLRSPLLWTSRDAWVDRFPDALFEPVAGEGTRVITVGVAAERLGAEGEGRLLLLGSAMPLYNESDGRIRDLDIDRDLIASSVRWLLREEDRSAGLAAVESQPFRLPAAPMRRLANLSAFALPGACFLLAFAVFWRRRR